eukprot:m.77966 g.77966  ORF g.77966 m.77966 type:complete len:209 (-) comp50530_c0_seq2:407-1033(-)
MFCACIDPRACQLSFLSNDDRQTATSNFYQYAVRRLQTWNDMRMESPSQEDFVPKRTQSSNLTNGYTPTQFGTRSSEPEPAPDQRRLEEGNLMKVVVLEHTGFLQCVGTYFAFLEKQNCQSKREETMAIFSWWKSQVPTFRNLAIVAASLFSVRMTSASVERLFSSAALIRTARRNRMGSELFDALICYAYNDPTLGAPMTRRRAPRK